MNLLCILLAKLSKWRYMAFSSVDNYIVKFGLNGFSYRRRHHVHTGPWTNLLWPSKSVLSATLRTTTSQCRVQTKLPRCPCDLEVVAVSIVRPVWTVTSSPTSIDDCAGRCSTRGWEARNHKKRGLQSDVNRVERFRLTLRFFDDVSTAS